MQNHQVVSQQTSQLLSLLQLASPALPIGAFSYSEGVETLVHWGYLTTADALTDWLTTELRYGTVQIDGAVLGRVHQAIARHDLTTVQRWNCWLSALRETEELRLQQWQMGRALLRLVQEVNLSSDPSTQLAINQLVTCCGAECNAAVAFGIAAYAWRIDIEPTLLGYLHSWAANLVSAGVRLIPLGQTAGQQILLDLQPAIAAACDRCLTLADDDLYSCSWGLSLASMNHEVQYSRLFRS
ncbi:MAG: urease accessory protein UreF [Cyanobacteria bacterium]|nr:urease accessory protein UreF [Cyanobacteriota bacterium]MDW8203018.1 urease accessory protein UreF [Cyanobacteriota bacterium SKYGB_h_bin112]